MCPKSVSQHTQPALPEGLRADMDRIAHAAHHDPTSVLGRQAGNTNTFIVFYSPDTIELSLSDIRITTRPIEGTDFFIYHGDLAELPEHYQLSRIDSLKHRHDYYDPYSFSPQISAAAASKSRPVALVSGEFRCRTQAFSTSPSRSGHFGHV